MLRYRPGVMFDCRCCMHVGECRRAPTPTSSSTVYKVRSEFAVATSTRALDETAAAELINYPARAYLENTVSIMEPPFRQLSERIGGCHHFNNRSLEGPLLRQDTILSSCKTPCQIYRSVANTNIVKVSLQQEARHAEHQARSSKYS